MKLQYIDVVNDIAPQDFKNKYYNKLKSVSIKNSPKPGISGKKKEYLNV
jgi:hypothetical protein